MQIKEFILAESFEVGTTPPQKLTVSKVKDMLKEYLYPKYQDNYEKVMLNMISSFENDTNWFKYSDDAEEYFVVFGRLKGSKLYEAHFANLKHIDEFNNIGGNESQALKVFSFVFKIIYWYGLVRGKDVKLESAPSENRSSFYKKIFDKIVRDTSLNYSAKVDGSSVVLLNNLKLSESGMLFSEKYI